MRLHAVVAFDLRGKINKTIDSSRGKGDVVAAFSDLAGELDADAGGRAGDQASAVCGRNWDAHPAQST